MVAIIVFADEVGVFIKNKFMCVMYLIMINKPQSAGEMVLVLNRWDREVQNYENEIRIFLKQR